jgi:hypothetical protein
MTSQYNNVHCGAAQYGRCQFFIATFCSDKAHPYTQQKQKEKQKYLLLHVFPLFRRIYPTYPRQKQKQKIFYFCRTKNHNPLPTKVVSTFVGPKSSNKKGRFLFANF